MKHIPFAALPAAERQALLDTLLRNGVPLRHVCVSRSDPAAAAGEGRPVTTVSAAGWSRSYEADSGWLALLERDLLALRPTARAQAAQSGIHEFGDTP